MTKSISVDGCTARPMKTANKTFSGSWLYFLFLGFLIAAPLLGAYPVFVMKMLCYALFACAFNLLLGFTGLLSFGHAAFFGFSAYCTGWLIKSMSLGPEFALIGGVLAAGALGLVFGVLAIRRQGIYFAMTTLALAQFVSFFCLQAPFTGGEDGLQGIRRGNLFGLISLESDMTMYYFVLVIATAGFLGILRIVRSPFGQVLKMIRENEPRAISLGYDVTKFKLLAFVLSSSMAGLAGGLKSIVMGFATLADVHWSMSGEVILMSLLGGVGTFFGPVLGASVVIALQNFLADKVGAWVGVIIGSIFVVCVLAFRKGIIGEFIAYRDRRNAV